MGNPKKLTRKPKIKPKASAFKQAEIRIPTPKNQNLQG